jgi:hypothetical protein
LVALAFVQLLQLLRQGIDVTLSQKPVQQSRLAADPFHGLRPDRSLPEVVLTPLQLLVRSPDALVLSQDRIDSRLVIWQQIAVRINITHPSQLLEGEVVCCEQIFQ